MRVRVATLNAWALPPPIGHQVARRIEAIGAGLADLPLDVIGFQEIWTRDARRALIRAGRRAGLVHAWHREAILAGSGLLVLSRFPIRAAHFERYLLGGLPQHLSQLDYYAGKGFAHLELETPVGAIALIDTHLQARYGSQMPHEYRGHRTGQLVQLARALQRISQPAIVLGDFNFREQHQEYDIWLGLGGVRDAAGVLDRREPTVFPGNPYRHSNRSRRIDYVFLRDGRTGGWEAREVKRIFDAIFELGGEPATFSDHAGVWAELKVVAGSGRPPPVRAGAVAQAASALSAGRGRALARRDQGRLGSGVSLVAAGLTAASLRCPSLSRRALLRRAMRVATAGALVPSLGYSAFSELWVPGEVNAFGALARQLAQLAGAEGEVWTAAPLERADFEPAQSPAPARPL